MLHAPVAFFVLFNLRSLPQLSNQISRIFVTVFSCRPFLLFAHTQPDLLFLFLWLFNDQ